jgi:hypothetical protein
MNITKKDGYLNFLLIVKNALGGDRTHDRWLIRPTL